jgi:IS605 OrfB family transposase
MKATLTLKMKLEITEAASNSLLETQKAHVVALNQTSDVAFEKKVFNSVIVDEALKANAGTIVIEDLKGIRERIKVAKRQRLIHPGWPFSSLFLKITHVASKDGIKVESVDARNTFRTCRCGQVDKANRTTQSTFR